MEKNLEYIFLFLDNCMGKYCFKFSLLRREYLPSAGNRLTNSPKILQITQRDFGNLNCLDRDQ